MAYQGRTLTELATELERQSKVKKDYKAPTTQLKLAVRQHKVKDVLSPERNSYLEFETGDKFSGPMTDLMHEQLASYTGIPSAYYGRMQQAYPELLAENVNTWLHAQKETRLIRTLDGRARAFLSNRYRTIDNSDVAEAVLPVLIAESKKLGSIEVVSSQVTDRRLYIKAISKRLTYDVKKGDAVQMGISISNSEVGRGSVKIEPFLLRLVCTNGAILEDSAVRKFHLGRQSEELEAAEAVFRDETRQLDDKAFVMKLQDIVRASFDDVNFAKLKGITVDATTRKIKAPIEDVVEEVIDEYKMRQSLKDSFLRNLIEGADLSQWGLANAVTAMANTAESYEEATELEAIGGNIIAMPSEVWRDLAGYAAA